MVELFASIKGEEVYLKYLPELVAEHQFWMAGSNKLNATNKAFKRIVLLNNQMVLNRYWDDDNTPRPEAYREDTQISNTALAKKETTYRNIRAAVESGWDFGSRWLEDGLTLQTIQTTEIIPVDLNCLLYNLEITISKTYLLKKNVPESAKFKKLASERKAAILKYCWDIKQGFFTDYQFNKQTSTRSLTTAGLFPLYFNLATEKQAEQVKQKVEEFFLYPGGLVTTPHITHQQWDAPNGWAPMQWIGYKGFKNYNMNPLADTIRDRWLLCVKSEYQKTGKMMERYNMLFPSIEGGGGQYPSQDGYGWTNGIYLQLLKEQGK
jgi:alpha,alpha-trehalase